MQLDQPRDVVDQLLGVLQLPHPLAGHLGADDLVVVERHPAVRLEPAGARLADVVQQCGQPQRQVRPVRLQRDRLLQHGQRVLVDVLVPVVLVLLQAQRRQLGHHEVGQPGVHQQPQALDRVLGEQQLVQLGLDPLGRHDGDPLGHRGHRGHHLGRRVEVQLGGEPGGPHHPQRVVGEGLLGGGGVRSTRASRSSRPWCGSTKPRPGRSTAIALTVKSRRTRSCPMVSP